MGNGDGETTRWIVWGIGEPTPDDAFETEVRDGTRAVAAARDSHWAAAEDGWSVVVTASSAELEHWIRRSASARGSAPLMQDTDAEPQPVERPRPY